VSYWFDMCYIDFGKCSIGFDRCFKGVVRFSIGVDRFSKLLKCVYKILQECLFCLGVLDDALECTKHTAQF